jgi:hypothetical protein
MGKIYWTREVKTLLDKKVNGIMDDLLADKDATDQDIVNAVRNTRVLKTFCDEVIAEMEEMDLQEDEAHKGGR